MDIKLRARLTAYSKIESFERPGASYPEHSCNMTPVSKECIDDLFRHDAPEVETPEQPVLGKSFIDALF